MKPQSAMAPMTLTIEGTTVKHRGCKGPLHSYIHMKDGTVVNDMARHH